jgi:hypothetical protein
LDQNIKISGAMLVLGFEDMSKQFEYLFGQEKCRSLK